PRRPPVLDERRHPARIHVRHLAEIQEEDGALHPRLAPQQGTQTRDGELIDLAREPQDGHIARALVAKQPDHGIASPSIANSPGAKPLALWPVAPPQRLRMIIIVPELRSSL